MVQASCFDKNDIFAKPSNDEQWEKLFAITEIKVIFGKNTKYHHFTRNWLLKMK